MQISHIPLLFMGLNTTARAEEPEAASLMPSIEVVSGIPPGLIPINHRLSVALDGHFFLAGKETSQIFAGGGNIGISYKNLELKPIGMHLHCHDEPCKMAYSGEAYGIINSDWAAGLGIAVSQTGITELRFPISYRGFSITPSVHQEDQEMHPAIKALAIFNLNPQFSIGPTCEISEELYRCGVSLWFGHAHEH